MSLEYTEGRNVANIHWQLIPTCGSATENDLKSKVVHERSISKLLCTAEHRCDLLGRCAVLRIRVKLGLRDRISRYFTDWMTFLSPTNCTKALKENYKNRVFADRHGQLIMSLLQCNSWSKLNLHYTEINNIMYAVKTLHCT